MRYQLTIAYDGTQYAGWQVQENAQSIQPLIQEALQTILRHPLDLTGSSRTDAGVHALGQIAHFDTEVIFETKRLLLSMNALLPVDIRILGIHPTVPDFHARYSASSKIYHYHLHLDEVADPFKKLYCHHVFGPFDATLMKEAAQYFLGTHDFTSFANTKERVKDPVRTLYRLDLLPEKGGLRLEFEGNGFLYKMVRNITGTLLDVAASRCKPTDIPLMFAARDRRKGGFTAPAQALFLVKVIFSKDSK